MITTLMIRYKHSVYADESEISPLFLLGVPLWLLFVFKLLAIAGIWWYFKNYRKSIVYLRYFVVMMIVLLTFIYLGLVINNFMWYRMPTEDLTPLKEEERMEAYVEQMIDMQVTESIIPKEKMQMPLLVTLCLWNMIVFVVWKSFEKDEFFGG